MPGADDYDVTTFSITLLSDQEYALFYYLADQFKSKTSIMGSQEMARLRELAQRKDIKAQLAFNKALKRELYGTTHRYYQTAVDEEAIANASKKTLAAWAKKSRTVAGATLVISGRFNARAMYQLALYYFGSKANHAPPTPAQGTVPTKGGLVSLVDEEADTLSISVAYRGGRGVDTSIAARRVLVAILDHRLRRLREVEGLSYGVYSRYAPERDLGMWWIEGDVDPRKAQDAMREIQLIIAELKANPSSYLKEFAQARSRLMSAYQNPRPSAATLRARLVRMARYDLEDDYVEHYVRSLAALRPGDVRRLLETEFTSSRRVVALRGPKTAVEAATAEAEKAPVLAPIEPKRPEETKEAVGEATEVTEGDAPPALQESGTMAE